MGFGLRRRPRLFLRKVKTVDLASVHRHRCSDMRLRWLPRKSRGSRYSHPLILCCRWIEDAQRSPTMSHHSDDNMLIASSDSFWEPNNYKRTTKRIEDGYKLCNELITLVQERSDIEKTYAKSLKSWSKKWNDLIEKGTNV